jgi:hypothetical protein
MRSLLKWNSSTKYQRGLIFNGFRPNSRRWKYATFFIGFVFDRFLSIWHEEHIIQQLKAWSFLIWQNLGHTQSNSDTIARWSSITFLLITVHDNTILFIDKIIIPVYNIVISRSFIVCDRMEKYVCIPKNTTIRWPKLFIYLTRFRPLESRLCRLHVHGLRQVED